MYILASLDPMDNRLPGAYWRGQHSNELAELYKL